MAHLIGVVATGLHVVHWLWWMHVLLHRHLNWHLHWHFHHPLNRYLNNLFNLNDLFDDFRLADTVVDAVATSGAD